MIPLHLYMFTHECEARALPDVTHASVHHLVFAVACLIWQLPVPRAALPCVASSALSFVQPLVGQEGLSRRTCVRVLRGGRVLW